MAFLGFCWLLAVCGGFFWHSLAFRGFRLPPALVGFCWLLLAFGDGFERLLFGGGFFEPSKEGRKEGGSGQSREHCAADGQLAKLWPATVNQSCEVKVRK